MSIKKREWNKGFEKICEGVIIMIDVVFKVGEDRDEEIVG